MVKPVQVAIKGEPEHWYFNLDRLLSGPSSRHGVDRHKELIYRQQTAQFIQDVGQKLTWPQLCMNTAIVYMHRFYVYHSFKDVPRHDLATAALFLAGKTEEQPRKLEHVVKVAYAVNHRDEPSLEVGSDKFLEEAQKVVMFENLLLTTLGFDLRIEHPHTHVVKCCQLVKAHKDLAQASYFLATDSLLLTNFCLRYRPTIVACVCIFLACKWAGWEIPVSSEGKPWFSYVDPVPTEDLLKCICEEFVEILKQSPQKLRKLMLASKGETSCDGSAQRDLSPLPPQAKMTKLEESSHRQAHSGAVDMTAANEWGATDGNSKRPPNAVGHEPATRPRPRELSPTNMKRVNTEPQLGPNVLDISRYKERRDQQPAEKMTSQLPTRMSFQARPSFIPDVSKEGWISQLSEASGREKAAGLLSSKESKLQTKAISHSESKVSGIKRPLTEEDKIRQSLKRARQSPEKPVSGNLAGAVMSTTTTKLTSFWSPPKTYGTASGSSDESKTGVRTPDHLRLVNGTLAPSPNKKSPLPPIPLRKIEHSPGLSAGSPASASTSSTQDWVSNNHNYRSSPLKTAVPVLNAGERKAVPNKYSQPNKDVKHNAERYHGGSNVLSNGHRQSAGGGSSKMNQEFVNSVKMPKVECHDVTKTQSHRSSNGVRSCLQTPPPLPDLPPPPPDEFPLPPAPPPPPPPPF